jgi:hypothetical protein
MQSLIIQSQINKNAFHANVQTCITSARDRKIHRLPIHQLSSQASFQILPPFSPPTGLLRNRMGSLATRVELELNKNYTVFHNGANRADQERQSIEQVLLLLAVRD